DTPSAFLASPEDDRLSSEAAARELLRPQTHSAVFGACVPQLAGMVGIYRDSARKAAHKAHLWGVFVLPAHRGHGFARLLLEAALLH
ncbi:GNAT family N-acetyltransferase, partial [Enterococcus faecium]